MPDFIKSLADVKEDRCTILMVFYCLVYGVREAMALLYCGVNSTFAVAILGLISRVNVASFVITLLK